MLKTLLTTLTISGILALGSATGSAALMSDAQNPVSKVGKATKDVGKGAVKGATETTKKAGEVTEGAATKTATETKNAGKTVQGAVTPGQTSSSAAGCVSAAG